jgi:hypothetical protein
LAKSDPFEKLDDLIGAVNTVGNKFMLGPETVFGLQQVVVADVCLGPVG